MACSFCQFQGFLESYTMRDAGMKPMIAQCPRCRDVSAYSRRVQQMLTSGVDAELPKPERPYRAREEAQIIPFRKKEKNVDDSTSGGSSN